VGNQVIDLGTEDVACSEKFVRLNVLVHHHRFDLGPVWGRFSPLSRARSYWLMVSAAAADADADLL
jgi:hypothetical protein